MAGCDELSIDPAVWKMAFKLKTSHKMILTTDALTLKGLPDGVYNYMGRELNIINGFAYTDYHGAERLPGKPMTFIGTVHNVMKNTGADLVDIVNMSCVNPAKRLKIDDRKGFLEIGFDADINILDKDNNLLETYIEGEKQ
ncbi:amidohydrolase family protein [Helcococcus kunzii]|uniref:amidohydrolase family protein n=1 Tax=Helcococcus kunzii TaxID=40091 RepID=UPI001C974D18|nr:amidohydrolase family protein [Helcococcus kunzii]QZO76162.1 amidohydrolase family protein [Helcococcus kunzii]